MAPSRACASACASRAPGAESVKVQDAKLAADPNAALQKGGVFGAKRKHLAEWKGSKNQDDCALGGTIGCVFCATPTATHLAAALTARTRSRNPRLAKEKKNP